MILKQYNTICGMDDILFRSTFALWATDTLIVEITKVDELYQRELNRLILKSHLRYKLFWQN